MRRAFRALRAGADLGHFFLRDLAAAVADCQLVIAVSAQAVEQANSHLRQIGLDWPERTYLAVGSWRLAHTQDLFPDVVFHKTRESV